MAKKPQATPYEIWLSRLSPAARKTLTVKTATAHVEQDDEKQDYSLWKAGLSKRAQGWIDVQSKVEEPPPQEEILEGARYGCVECQDGEFPVVRLFKTEEALAKHIGKCEGVDSCLVAFFGHFLRFSKGPQRYIFTPDGDELLLIPRNGIGPVKRVESSIVTFDWQEDGFVGPPELADTSALEAELDEEAKKYEVKPAPDYVDEDDEDDEEEEGPE